MSCSQLLLFSRRQLHSCVSCLFVRREIVDNHEKENALNIVTDERTYQVFAESPEDARYGRALSRCVEKQRHVTVCV